MDKPGAILPPGLANLSIEQRASEQTNELDQDAFLKLMVTQLENQDPLNPADSGDFLGQLAQFSTVSGIGDLKESFATVAGALQSSQALQASTMVGREVLVPGSTAELDSAGASVNGAVSLPQASGSVAVQVFDGAGQLVRHLELGQQSEGLAQFTWDGMSDAGVPAEPGRYRVQAEALLGEDRSAVPVLLRSRVESVSLQAGQSPVLNVAGQGTVSMNEVEQIL